MTTATTTTTTATATETNTTTTMIIEETGKFSVDEIGNPVERQAMINMIANAPKAGIIHVHAYESKGGYGEVANYFYLKGVDYGKMKERSLEKLNEIANDENFSISVTRGVWVNADGTYTNRKAKGRTYKVITEDYDFSNPLVSEAIAEIENSILNPYKKTADYNKEGNGIYSLENGNLHIRDCQLIHKEVLRKGDYPQKATGEKVALRDAIKRNLPISKYRQVSLEGIFDYITIGGQLLMQDENENDAYVGFKEHKGLIEPRINGLEETLEAVKVPTDTLVQTEIAETSRQRRIRNMFSELF